MKSHHKGAKTGTTVPRKTLLIEHHMTLNGFSFDHGMHLHEFPGKATCLAALKTALIFGSSRGQHIYLYSSIRLQHGWQQGVSNLDS